MTTECLNMTHYTINYRLKHIFKGYKNLLKETRNLLQNQFTQPRRHFHQLVVILSDMAVLDISSNSASCIFKLLLNKSCLRIILWLAVVVRVCCSESA